MVFLLENIIFKLLFVIIENPIVFVGYYRLPFFSNIKTQVVQELRVFYKKKRLDKTDC